MSEGQKLTAKSCLNKPILTFSMLAWEKIWKITHSARIKKKAYECSSLGIMSPTDPSHLLDIYVPVQENTPTNTEIEKADKHEWLTELISQGVDASQLSLWHHTHADMKVFWSSTDSSTIEDAKSDEIHWSVCTNVDGDIKVRADIFYPIRFWWDDCDYEIDYPKIDLDEWMKQQKQKMTFSEPVSHIKVRKGYSSKPNVQHWGGYATSYSTGYGLFSNESEDVVPASKKERPYEVLSNRKLQEAYDCEVISHEEALLLEKQLLLKVKTQPEVEDTLREMLKKDGLESLIDDEEDLIVDTATLGGKA